MMEIREVINYYHGMSSIDWAPIMGGDKVKTTHQWNNGNYEEANNKEDDVKKIANRLGYRANDYFDYPHEKNGKKVYPEIELNKKYPSFISPHPKQPDGEIVNSSVTLDHDYFKFSLNNQDVEIMINKIQTAPTLFFKAKLYKIDSNNNLTPLNNYTFSGNKFSPQLSEPGIRDYLIKVSTDSKSFSKLGYYGSLGQYMVEVKNLLDVESPRDVRDDEVVTKLGDQGKIPRISSVARRISANKGRTAVFNGVYYSTSPIKKIQWRIYNKGEETNTDNYLKILSRKKVSFVRIENWMHNKVIKAMAENEFGRGFSGTATVSVKNHSPHRGVPVIVHEPLKIRLNPGRNHNFTVVADGEGIQYQWYKNGNLIGNNNHPILSLKNITSGDRGTYYVKVKNNHGEVKSKDFTLNVTGYTLSGSSGVTEVKEKKTYLSFTETPKGGEVNEGKTFAFSSNANTSVNYQWYKNDRSLPNQKGNSLSFSNISKKDEGWYFVEISKDSKKVRSPKAHLKVITKKENPPSILMQPVSMLINPGSDYKLTVLASGSNLNYQWIKNGTPISGARSSQYFIKKATTGDKGNYAVKVSNSSGSVVSNNAIILIGSSSLKIVKNLTSLQVNEGESAQFNIIVSGGSGRYTYYWYKDGKLLKDTSYSSYRMTSAYKKDGGIYHGIVKDGTNEIMSSKVSLVVKTQTGPEISTEEEKDGPSSLVYCFCNKSLKNYNDLCLRSYQWKCQSIGPSLKKNENVINDCVEGVKNDLKSALRVLMEEEDLIISQYDQCFDYAHPFLTKGVEDSSCESFGREVASFVDRGNNFSKLKNLFKKPESIGFCLKSYLK